MTSIPEIIFSGFVSKVVNDIVDVSKDKIGKAVKNKATKHQNLESQIYNVTVDVLNKITDNQYGNNQGKIYDAAEVLLKSFKGNDRDKLGNIKLSLQNTSLYVEFKVSLYEELGKDEYSELFRVILLLLLEQKNQYDHVVYEQLNQKLDEVGEKVDKLNQKLDDIPKGNESTIIKDKVVKFQNNKKQKYIENWNSRLFLHIDNDEKPITLKDAFIMPDYDIYNYRRVIETLKGETFEETVESYVNCKETSVLLIAGVPGMGKTTITSWLANKYEKDDTVIILRFRDWESEELGSGLLKAICNILMCKRRDLNDKVIVLDGFDEIKCLDRREHILNDFFNDIKDLERSKFIILSRPAYIDEAYFNRSIVLRPFEIKKIERFYYKITGIVLNRNDVDIDNLDVLGVPVILYMAIMSSIDITKNTTKPELYNRIFAEKGGIFDKFGEYDRGSQIMRNHDNIKSYLDFLRKVAFKMFEKNDFVLIKDEYKIPKFPYQGNSVSILEFPIKHLFENTLSNIEFIHRSIYEYFVSEYIFDVLFTEINDFVIEHCAGTLGKLLKSNNLSSEIIEFLKFRVRKNKIINKKFELINKTFLIMLENGMTYYTNICYKNVIQCEMNVFANMLEIVHLWENSCLKFDESIYKYLKYNRKKELNLIGVVFLSSDLSETYLRKAKLENASLKGKKLIGADLQETDLTGANLRGTDLRGANIKDIKLINAQIRNVVFDEKQIYNLEKKYHLKGTKIYFEGTKKVISYEEYCFRKKN